MPGLNPGIVKIVALLNELGYRTTDSGDGETHDHECDRDEGYVVVVLDSEQDMVEAADRIAKELTARGVPVGDGIDPSEAMVQATYSPVDMVKTVDIHGIHDRMLKDA